MIHGQKSKRQKHLKVLGNMNEPKTLRMTPKWCKGALYWDEGLEGNVCTLCSFYDGAK